MAEMPLLDHAHRAGVNISGSYEAEAQEEWNLQRTATPLPFLYPIGGTNGPPRN